MNYGDDAEAEIDRLLRRIRDVNDRRKIEVDAAWRAGLAQGRREAGRTIALWGLTVALLVVLAMLSLQ